jgi:hypothetical protein
MKIDKIVSGGQTGADRAALDVALELGIPYGGWIPRGRLAEDGRISATYAALVECDSPDPEVRTRLNVRDSDATLILSTGSLRGGSSYTREVALKLGKPIKHVTLDGPSMEEAVRKIGSWLSEVKGRVLNIAGPRHSEDPDIYDGVRTLLPKLLKAQ